MYLTEFGKNATDDDFPASTQMNRTLDLIFVQKNQHNMSVPLFEKFCKCSERQKILKIFEKNIFKIVHANSNVLHLPVCCERYRIHSHCAAIVSFVCTIEVFANSSSHCKHGPQFQYTQSSKHELEDIAFAATKILFLLIQNDVHQDMYCILGSITDESVAHHQTWVSILG